MSRLLSCFDNCVCTRKTSIRTTWTPRDLPSRRLIASSNTPRPSSFQWNIISVDAFCGFSSRLRSFYDESASKVESLWICLLGELSRKKKSSQRHVWRWIINDQSALYSRWSLGVSVLGFSLAGGINSYWFHAKLQLFSHSPHLRLRCRLWHRARGTELPHKKTSLAETIERRHETHSHCTEWRKLFPSPNSRIWNCIQINSRRSHCR